MHTTYYQCSKISHKTDEKCLYLSHAKLESKQKKKYDKGGTTRKKHISTSLQQTTNFMAPFYLWWHLDHQHVQVYNMSVYIHVLHFLNSNEIDYIRMYNGEFYVHVDATCGPRLTKSENWSILQPNITCKSFYYFYLL